ncbi:MAG: hypothetical protein GY943_39085 [Chloroflexi bacterium]|nr:hypothetical protein [Chloroflexota bacterium]
MTSLETLTANDLNEILKSSSIKKARGFVSRVRNGTRHGQSLFAKVGKSRMYQVEIEVDAGGIHAVCSCPYNWGGYCKHIGALLLKWVEAPNTFVIEMPAPSANIDTIIETFDVEPPATAVPAKKPFWLTMPHQLRCQQNDAQLTSWLNEYKAQELRQMAKEQNWPIKGTRKADIIQQIMSHLMQPSNIFKSLLNLDEEHRIVYDAIGLLHPENSLQENHLNALGKQWGGASLSKQIDIYNRNLCKRGLAMPASFSHHYWQQTAFIPSSLMRVLPPLLTNHIPEATLSQDTISTMVLAQKRPFLQRIHQVIRLLEQGNHPLRPPMPRPRLQKFYEFLQEWDYVPEEILAAKEKNKLKSNTFDFSLTIPPPQPALPDNVIARLSPIAGGETQLNFIYHLLLTAGLLQPGSPVTVWRELKEQFSHHDEAAQWMILADAYLMSTTWSEMWMVLAERPSLQLKRSTHAYYHNFQPDNLYQTLAGFREQVLRLLACLPDNRWVNLSDITDLLHPLWSRFDGWARNRIHHNDKMKPEWFLAENGRHIDTSKNKTNWDNAQGAFVQQIIQGSLHWLGIADICVENGRLTAFRLHGLNDLFFDKVASVPLEDRVPVSGETAVSSPNLTDAISIHGNSISVNPTTIPAQAHNYLDNIAKLKETSTERFVYQFQAAAVHEAFESGQTLSQLVDSWGKWLTVPIPTHIHKQLTDWWESYGHIRLYEDITVIEFGDEYALAEMKATTSLKQHLIAEISPTLVIIPVDVVDRLVSELETAGYTPKATDKV